MSLVTRLADAEFDWLLPEWAAHPEVAGFATTRNGGVGTGDRATLDLGPALLATLEPATRNAVLENRRRVGTFLPAPPVWLEQVHGCRVAIIDAHNLDMVRETPPQADAAVTRLVDVPLAVRVADCLPVLFADDTGGIVGVAHAGWRGLATGVLEATLDAMDVAAPSVCAWIGPGIGPTAFEVGADVRDAFCSVDDGNAMHFAPLRRDKWLADLPALAARRLRRAGVDRVSGGRDCTYSDSRRFFSYRRDGTPGRMAALVWRASAR